MGHIEYKWVASAEAFRQMLDALAPVARIAVDIEADSLYHYFEKVCLVQISTDLDTFVIDPLAIHNLQALAPMMADPCVEKVFHAASYDISCLRRDYSFSFANIFDTLVAAQFIGYHHLGLSTLMETLLRVTHSKRRQRDDWSRRPLQPEQLEYAAMDTHHLLRMRDVLEQQLREKGRLSWAQEEFVAAVTGEPEGKRFDPEGFRRIKGSRQLSPKQTAILRALYQLRDRHARQMDIPPFKLIGNSALLDLTRKPPHSAGELFRRPGISYRVARKLGKEICNTIVRARSQPPSAPDKPQRDFRKPATREARLRLEQLKLWRKAKAAALDLAPGVLFPGNLLEALALSPPTTLSDLQSLAGMSRWRIREFGEEILRILQAA